MSRVILASLLLLQVAATGHAQGEPAAKLPPYDPAKAREAARIQDPKAATRAYLQAVSAERRAMTKSYALGEYFLTLTGYCVTSLILLGILGSGLSARLRNWAQRRTRFRALQTVIYSALFLLLLSLLSFPLTWYRSYYRATSYGLLHQSFAGWLVDQTKGLAILLVIVPLLLVVLYAVVRCTPRTWWLWGWLVVVGFAVVGMAIAPVFLSPLFNKFTPVQDANIRERVLKLAHEQHVPADDVYEMDASRRTDNIGAYVAGMLGTTRIVLFDNLLKRCTPEQIEMVMSHEMGHYVLNHIWKDVGIFSVVALAGFLCVRWAFARILASWPAAGIKDSADVAGLPLLIFLFMTISFLTAPLLNGWSRTVEMQADTFGLNACRQPDAAATTFLMLGEYRELDPHPVAEFLFFDHPSGQNRIRNALEWKKAHKEKGES
ncbi:MAG TPA: M48 family metallopeptidase [Gemmataceae bacterium]|nr:M48 family metallopeptidase [Gemmataceae bacterium]